MGRDNLSEVEEMIPSCHQRQPPQAPPLMTALAEKPTCCVLSWQQYRLCSADVPIVESEAGCWSVGYYQLLENHNKTVAKYIYILYI